MNCQKWGRIWRTDATQEDRATKLNIKCKNSWFAQREKMHVNCVNESDEHQNINLTVNREHMAEVCANETKTQHVERLEAIWEQITQTSLNESEVLCSSRGPQRMYNYPHEIHIANDSCRRLRESTDPTKTRKSVAE